MAVQGDLSSNTQLEVKKYGSLLLVDDIQFANFKLDGRSALEPSGNSNVFRGSSFLDICCLQPYVCVFVCLLLHRVTGGTAAMDVLQLCHFTCKIA